MTNLETYRAWARQEMVNLLLERVKQRIKAKDVAGAKALLEVAELLVKASLNELRGMK